MNKRRFRDWTLEDPEVQQILAGAIRSSKQSYYRVINGRHVKATLKADLMKLPMNGVTASKLLAEYPFPEAPFIRNRKRDENLTEEALLAKRERQAIRKAKAVSISDGLRDESLSGFIPAAKEMKESDTMEPIPAIEESPVQELELSVHEETERCRSPREIDAEELLETKNRCLIKRGVWWGIYHTREGSVHLISKDREEAVAVLASYGKVKECHRWN